MLTSLVLGSDVNCFGFSPILLKALTDHKHFKGKQIRHWSKLDLMCIFFQVLHKASVKQLQKVCDTWFRTYHHTSCLVWMPHKLCWIFPRAFCWPPACKNQTAYKFCQFICILYKSAVQGWNINLQQSQSGFNDLILKYVLEARAHNI